MQLVLASTSPFRKALLQRLQLDFDTVSPDVDETPLADESIDEMVMRLSQAKARAAAETCPDSLIIGSDQSAELNGQPLSKPGGFDKAFQQLRAASGQRIVFHTGLCLYNSATGKSQLASVPYTVVFKSLSDNQIEYYLRREQPYNCAGSFKSEGLGITLFEKFEGEDPNALIGLPLIKLIDMLANEGISPLS